MVEFLRKVFKYGVVAIKVMGGLCANLATLAYYKVVFPITLRLKNVGSVLSSAKRLGKELLKAPVRMIELVVLLFFSPTYAYYKGRSYWARTFGSVHSYVDDDSRAECKKGAVSSRRAKAKSVSASGRYPDVFECCDHLADLTFYLISAPARLFSREKESRSELNSKRPG